MQEFVFTDIADCLTLAGAAAKGARRVTEEDLSIVSDAALVTRHGRIAWVGRRADLPAEFSGLPRKSLGGATVLPGLVECHTHLVFAGSRAHEFEWRMQGQTYQEISAKGGGILSTVGATRAATEAELARTAQMRADRFVRQGVTTLEAKSGYGLDLENELKCLRVARSLRGPRVVATYLGAHSRSPDHPDLQAYLTHVLDVVLPEVARSRLADRVDIYVEKGFFDRDQARAYLGKARALGLSVTAHVEQLSDSGGADVALEFQPQSVDHVVYLGEESLRKVATSETTAVLLPASDFYLKMRYPPARALLDQGGRVALSTDFNPGTSPTQDLSLVGVLARIEMKMSLAEVIAAFTLGGAHALGLHNEVGSLEAGKQCDFLTLDGHWRELFYSVGHHPVRETFRLGEALRPT